MKKTEVQFKRVVRSLKKVSNNRNRDLHEYEDDVRNFYIECWSLKDYVKNNSAFSSTVQNRVEGDLSQIHEMMLVSDVCNGAKHFVLSKPRVGAKISKRNLHIHSGTANVRNDGTQSTSGAYGELEYEITDAMGRSYTAIDLARKATDEWRKLLTGYGLNV